MADFLLLMEAERLQRIANLRVFRRHLRDTTNPFDLPEEQFRQLYRPPESGRKFTCSIMEIHSICDRFTQQGVLQLIEELRPFLSESHRPGAIAIHQQVLIALNVLGNGLYQKPAGLNYMACVSQSSVSNVLHRVVEGLNHLMDEWITFPTTPEQVFETQRRFWDLHHFPGIIGVVDGTHIAIVRPSEEQEYLYFNRKLYHSLNVMIVCDADMNITFVNAAHGGRTHDSRVFAASLLSHHLQVEFQQGRRIAWLLGDSGYPLLPYLLTPLADQAEGTPGYAYTRALCRTRSLVERVIGLLKGVFRYLLRDRTLHYDPVMAGSMVNAACVLHNMRLRWKMNDVREPIYLDEMDLEGVERALEDLPPDDAAGVAVRDTLINDFFQREMA